MKLSKIPMHESWAQLLKEELSQDYMTNLEKFLTEQENLDKIIYPESKNIFSALSATSFEDVKVVIIGQDPYHGENQAHGLSFSVNKEIKIPPSLRNIYKELHSDLGLDIPTHGNLSSWANQGVLLLNNVLTVEKSLAASHQKKGWEKFTDKIIDLLNEKNENIVFILWGGPAQKKAKKVDEKKHFILKSPHPSPLSSYRGFFDSRPFSKTNTYLKENGIKEIDWSIPI